MKKYIMFIILFTLAGCGVSNDNILTDLESEDGATRSIQILALGDSITAGYNLPLQDSYPQQLEEKLNSNNYLYEVINAGVSGDTSAQLLDRIDIYLDEDKLPELALLTIGGNDGLRGLSIAEMKKNIAATIDKLQEKNITVVLSGMQIPLNLGLNYSVEFKNTYKQLAKEKDVLLFPYFLKGVGGNRKYNLSDNIHPNKEGYTIISNNIYDFLEDNGVIKK